MSLMRILAATCWLAGTGCGPDLPAPACVTPCGMRIRGYWPDGEMPFTCEEVSAYEDTVLFYFVHVLDDRFRPNADACKALARYDVWFNRGPDWIDSWNRKVQGLTHCTYGVIQSGVWPNLGLKSTALAHEMAHAIQWCETPAPIDDGPQADWQHANWYRDNIFQMLRWVEESP